MSGQHAAEALTVAAVIATVLVVGAVVRWAAGSGDGRSTLPADGRTLHGRLLDRRRRLRRGRG
ncbi:hypothetical protein [Streptomyces sp. NPDC088760]|uniref:hypothetical protein n=1 Tax=Streptomyces sp. NPDC088760 TaxID=3365890 RepID=UPI0037FE1EA9